MQISEAEEEEAGGNMMAFAGLIRRALLTTLSLNWGLGDWGIGGV